MATFNKFTRTIAPIRGQFLRTFAQEDGRAMRGWMASKSVANNVAGQVKTNVRRAQVLGRDASFTASRTWDASRFTGKGLGYHAMVGSGIGAAMGAGNAYMNGQDPGRGGLRGAMYGAGAGLAAGAGRSLYKGYAKQAESRVYGTAMTPFGPQMGSPRTPGRMRSAFDKLRNMGR